MTIIARIFGIRSYIFVLILILMDGVLTTFDEFLDHMKKHMTDLHSEVVINDRLYSAEDYPKLKSVVVESGMAFVLFFYH